MAYRQIEVDCGCGETVPVEGIKTTLMNEDWSPITVTCKGCGEMYRVELHMTFLGKAKEPTHV